MRKTQPGQEDVDLGLVYLARGFNLLAEPGRGYMHSEAVRTEAMRLLKALLWLHINAEPQQVGQVAAAEGDVDFQRFLAAMLGQGRP